MNSTCSHRLLALLDRIFFNKNAILKESTELIVFIYTLGSVPAKQTSISRKGGVTHESTRSEIEIEIEGETRIRVEGEEG